MTMADDQHPLTDDAFTIWINRPSRDARHLGNSGAIIKKGRDVTKTVAVTSYGDKRSGEVKKRELKFRTYENRRDGRPDYDQKEKNSWFCENDEIERVLAFLQSDVTRTGRYRIIDTGSPDGIVLDLLKDGNSSSQDLADIILQQGDLSKLVTTLSASTRGHSIAQLAVIDARRRLVNELQDLIRKSTTTETDIQNRIGNSYWIFGGRYVGIADRRSLIPLDQHDIPLLGADETLHIVELKGPCISKLVRHHRNHWIVGNDINEAVGQAMNYVRAFDELGTTMSNYYRTELGYEYNMRRVFTTVVIGNARSAGESGFGDHTCNERVVRDTIRSYNAHLSRVEVRTYDELFDTAERALSFENDSTLSNPQKCAVSGGLEDPPASPLLHEDSWSDEPPF
jgi:hypothetical protein